MSCAGFQGECFQLMPIQYDVGCGVFIYGSYYLRYVPSIPSSLRVFNMNGHLILLEAFSGSIEIIMWFSSLVLFM